MWIDRFTEFVSGQRATAIKTVTTAEEAVDEYLPGFPFLPQSLVVEGMAQTAGILAGECRGFVERVVLAKVGKAVFHTLPRTGSVLTYQVELEDIQDDGAIASGVSRIDGQLHAEIELVFAHLEKDRFPNDLFTPFELLAMLRVFGLYDVGRDADGRPLQPPQRMLDAEDEETRGY